MSLLVKKFGGSSVADLEKIQKVADIVEQSYKEKNKLVIVLSAMSGETDRMLNLVKDICDFPDGKALDSLLASGEQVSISLLSICLNARSIPSTALCGFQAKIVTDQAHTKAHIEYIDPKRIRKELAQNKVVIVAGFQGVSENGDITTLGRGGSDLSAVALASSLQATECQIYSDVNGVYTADPRIVSEAQKIPRLTFEEMLELASAGSKVLQTRSVHFASKYKMPIRALCTFNLEDTEGTLITHFEEGGISMEAPVVSGIATTRNEAKITIRNVKDTPGVAAEIIERVAEQGIILDMIVQNISNQKKTTDFSFTVERPDYKKAIFLMQDYAKNHEGSSVEGDDKVAKVSIVGLGMRSHAGVAQTMFQALAQNSINILMISTSEIKISVLIDEKYLELAARSLHEVFGLAEQPD